MHLYETHLPVADMQAAEKFYREIVGLPFAYRDPTRDIVFLLADLKEKAMIGLWVRWESELLPNATRFDRSRPGEPLRSLTTTNR